MTYKQASTLALKDADVMDFRLLLGIYGADITAIFIVRTSRRIFLNFEETSYSFSDFLFVVQKATHKQAGNLFAGLLFFRFPTSSDFFNLRFKNHLEIKRPSGLALQQMQGDLIIFKTLHSWKRLQRPDLYHHWLVHYAAATQHPMPV